MKRDFPYYFDVLVDVPLPAGEGLYTYGSHIKLQIGEKVIVPFGKKNKPIPGYVLSPGEFKKDAKAVLEGTGKKYFDGVRAAIMHWIWQNYISSSKTLLDLLPLQLLEEALTKVSLSFDYSGLEGKLGLKRKTSWKRLISFLQDRGGAAYLKEIPKSRALSSLLKVEAVKFSLESLKEQVFKKNTLKSVLFWSPWKEQLYFLLRLLREAQKQRKQALVLIPENSLMEPLLSLLEKEKVEAVSYSGEQSSKLKRQIIFKCQHEESFILLGTWLSLFLPFFNLGLICVLQEESPAYRVLSPPNFQAVSVAKRLAMHSGCGIYLFSRAPSLSSYLEAYRKQTLVVGESKQIEKSIIHYRGEKGLAPEVLRAIKLNSQEGKRTLIFLNRRGYANCLQCEDCGEAFSCPNCGVRLTPHSQELICHYCSYRRELPLFCPNCHGTNLKAKGIGLEKLEQQLKTIFGELVVTVSSEVAKSKKAVRAKIETFKSNRSSILLGTSILQGHALPLVPLVVLVNLDFSLSLPFYSASERAYQLYKNLESLASERIVLQVSRPLNPDWINADFYMEELRNRKQTNFPPFKRILRILFQAERETALWDAARKVEEFLSNFHSFVATQPMPCYHDRIKGKWRAEILVRFPIGPIPEEFKTLYRVRLPKKVEMQLQLDPEELD